MPQGAMTCPASGLKPAASRATHRPGGHPGDPISLNSRPSATPIETRPHRLATPFASLDKVSDEPILRYSFKSMEVSALTRRLKPRLVAFGWPSACADGKPGASAQADARPQALRRDFSRPLKASPNCLMSKNLVFA